MIKTQDERQRIGRLIATIRLEKHLTQQQLADKVCISREHLSRIESGRYAVGLDILAKIADVLGREINLTEKGGQ